MTRGRQCGRSRASRCAGAIVYLLLLLSLPAPLCGQAPTPASRSAAYGRTEDSRRKLIHYRESLFWGFIIFLVFLVAAGVIVRFSVRFRVLLVSDRRKPTPDSDVWRMHKLPGDDDADEGHDES